MFVDEAEVQIRAGDGGAGVAAFHKERGRPRGRPEGGSGGAGGDVILEADPRVASLLDYQRHPHRRAGDGAHGRGGMQHGRTGADLVLAVPVGTVVRDDEGTILADLAEPGSRVVVLEGGRGGRGNAALASARNVAPTFAEQGEYGAEVGITLELKLTADAAIVGFPNAGKSTLISRVSAARPKVADYPFTTLEPHLGVVEVDDRQFVLADIPGLVEGAAEGRGLGHAFLRHAERARALLLLLDPSPLQEMPVARQHGVLLAELERHDPALAARPRVVAVNKADLPGAAEAAASLAVVLGRPVLAVSGITGEGVEALMHAVADVVEQAVREAPGRLSYLLHRPAPPGFSVRREGERWVVAGKAAERAVALDDLTVPEAADFASRRLARAGVDQAL
ncbi:MAG TPA: GTPase ObgE, partial [Acidimicrobiia bacterium]|nr:GTPase ObgE [Acidimicrobiia bacterium]